MPKQIYVKSVNGSPLLKKMYDEAQTYLGNIGFSKTPLFSLTDSEVTIRSFLFSTGHEKVIMEYKKDLFEEVLKLNFAPLEIKFVYDILLMRFNQLASEERGNVYIYNE